MQPSMRALSLINRPDLLLGLRRYQTTHNIQVTPMSQSSYVIGLEACINLLQNMRVRVFSLEQLFAQDKLGGSPSEWIETLRGFDQCMTEAVSSAVSAWPTGFSKDLQFLQECMTKWANMPSAAVYSLIPLDNGGDPLTLNICQHRDVLTDAVSINRIILRAVEIVAHEKLQGLCKHILQSSPKIQEPEMVSLARDLGEAACSLRLRIAWSEIHELLSAPAPGQMTQTQPMETMRKIARILYFWYLNALKKREKYVEMNFDGDEHFLNVHGLHISDPLPTVDGESDNGFDTWLRAGRTVLSRACFGVQQISHQNPVYAYPSHDQSYPPYNQSAFTFGGASFQT